MPELLGAQGGACRNFEDLGGGMPELLRTYEGGMPERLGAHRGVCRNF